MLDFGSHVQPIDLVEECAGSGLRYSQSEVSRVGLEVLLDFLSLFQSKWVYTLRTKKPDLTILVYFPLSSLSLSLTRP